MEKQVLEDLMQDCPCDHSKWCFLRELLKHIGVGEREAEHMRLVFDYKFFQSADEGRDIGEERALREWVTKGYASRFVEIYNEKVKKNEKVRHEDMKYLLLIEHPETGGLVISKDLSNGEPKKEGEDNNKEKDPVEILQDTWKKKSIDQQVLEDLMQDCPCDHSKWCFLRELLKHTGVGDREAEQIRMIYALKFIMSKKIKKDVGEKAALDEWILGGYAKLFREIYTPGMKHGELKYKMFVENAPAVVRTAE